MTKKLKWMGSDFTRSPWGYWFVIAFIVATMVLPRLTETCFTGKFIVESSMYGAVVVGDQSICGKDLHFTSMTGPSKLQGGRVERPASPTIPIS